MAAMSGASDDAGVSEVLSARARSAVTMERLRRCAPAVFLGLLGASEHAIAGDPKPPSLPPGCERWIEVGDVALSLDDKRLAFVRWETNPDDVDYRGNPIPRPRVFVRTLATKRDVPVPDARGVPVGWTATGGLSLSSGEIVDPGTGKRVPGTAVVPEGIPIVALAWTRDGKRLAFVANASATWPPDERVPKVPTLVEVGKPPRQLDFGNNVYARAAAALSWSPDGKHVAFDMAFFVNGQVPPRRVGVISVEGPGQKIVGEMPLGNGIPGFGTAWDGRGDRFAYVRGDGDGNADLYLADADGTKVWRQTTDGATKWSPAPDPSGRRVAFLTGRVVDSGVEARRIRVLDVLTGDTSEFELPGSSEMPSSLAWTADGTRVFYELHGGDARGTFAQTIPAPKPAPPGATIRNVAVKPLDEFAGALRSGKPQRIETACENADSDWDDARLTVLREVFPAWIDADTYGPARAILSILGAHGAGVAVPEVRKALGSKHDLVVREAIGVLQSWRATETIPDLDAIRTKHRSAETRVRAAGAMVVLGDERGWPDLESAAKDPEPMVRSQLCYSLGDIGAARSVEILLPLVADDGFLYTTIGGDQCVGDHAVRALVRLTGKFFRRDSAKWTSWWKNEAHAKLPEQVDTAEAFKSYEAWMQEREEEHQRKMRAK
jgi:hypothetical protein